MLDEIQVKNLALIRDASLMPSRGLTVLTGETGAGKTALINALKLLMGGRASADMVRDGERELAVSGRFYGLEGRDADDEVVVVRRVNAEGRLRATLNGTMASAGELAQVIAPSVDLCGQFEHQQLMKVATHLALLDAWAGDQVEDARRAYADAFAAAQAAAAELQDVRDSSELTAAKLDEARFTLKRIDDVSPLEGEYEELQHDLQIAEHAESLARAVAQARSALADDGGALDALNTAAAALEGVAAVDADLAQMAQTLREAGYALEDVSAQTRDYAGKVEFDPEQLAFQQERFSQLQGLMRAYGPRMQDVLERRDEAARTISLVDDFDANLQRAQVALDAAEAELAQAAQVLDDARRRVAPDFARQVTEIMADLQMGGAQLVCEFGPLLRESWTKAGPSAFEFLYKPVADARPRPLTRIASGGEVSRVLLAVKTVLGAHDEVDTLVFDEVDAGVGGAVAVSLAHVLADLAKTHQVIVVTHLAQVAVFGDTHYVVQRVGDETDIVQVCGDDREREIARMLSGQVTDTSLAHARELLA